MPPPTQTYTHTFAIAYYLPPTISSGPFLPLLHPSLADIISRIQFKIEIELRGPWNFRFGKFW